MKLKELKHRIVHLFFTPMTLDEITKIDKELVAARYEAAISEEFGALARFLDTTIRNDVGSEPCGQQSYR